MSSPTPARRPLAAVLLSTSLLLVPPPPAEAGAWGAAGMAVDLRSTSRDLVPIGAPDAARVLVSGTPQGEEDLAALRQRLEARFGATDPGPIQEHQLAGMFSLPWSGSSETTWDVALARAARRAPGNHVDRSTRGRTFPSEMDKRPGKGERRIQAVQSPYDETSVLFGERMWTLQTYKIFGFERRAAARDLTSWDSWKKLFSSRGWKVTSRYWKDRQQVIDGFPRLQRWELPGLLSCARVVSAIVMEASEQATGNRWAILDRVESNAPRLLGKLVAKGWGRVDPPKGFASWDAAVEVSYRGLEPGDVVFWKSNRLTGNHIGVYIGNGITVDNNGLSGRVEFRNLRRVDDWFPWRIQSIHRNTRVAK